jgi:hypothetical protein
MKRFPPQTSISVLAFFSNAVEPLAQACESAHTVAPVTGIGPIDTDGALRQSSSGATIGCEMHLLPYPSNRQALVSFLFLALGCSNGTGLQVSRDSGGAGGASTTMPGPDAFAPSGSGGAPGPGSGGSPGSGGARTETSTGGAVSSGGHTQVGTGGTGGGTSVAPAPDASASGGAPGTVDASKRDGNGADRISPVEVPYAVSPDVAVWSDAGDGGRETAPSDVCSEAPCLAALFLPCQPSGVCTSEDTSPATANQTYTYCYPNGVKQQSTMSLDGTKLNGVFTEKLGSVVCFSIEVSSSDVASTALYVFRDGDGRQVATGILTTSTDTLMVTCEGAAPAQLSQSCMNTASTGNSCNTGACSF